MVNRLLAVGWFWWHVKSRWRAEVKIRVKLKRWRESSLSLLLHIVKQSQVSFILKSWNHNHVATLTSDAHTPGLHIYNITTLCITNHFLPAIWSSRHSNGMTWHPMQTSYFPARGDKCNLRVKAASKRVIVLSVDSKAWKSCCRLELPTCEVGMSKQMSLPVEMLLWTSALQNDNC